MFLYNLITLEITLISLRGVVHCDLVCTSTYICPPDKPYCTNSGCVFECPESSYINGTVCVAECVDSFVLNKTCVSNCPEKMFYRETPKLVGRDIFIEKFCVSTCRSHEYLFNGTCVNACPLTHKYINGRNCSRACSEEMPLKTNFTINRIIFHDCIKECEHLVEDGYCTEQCSETHAILNSVCVNSCPSPYPFISEQRCVRNCPSSTVYIQGKTCFLNCPLNSPFSYNDTCVSDCPTDFYKTLNNGKWHCIPSCANGMFVYNQTCVWECPKGMFINNKTCGTECSTSLPFSCEVPDQQNCDSSDSDVIFTDSQIKRTICLEYCPDNTFALDSKCLSICPTGYKHFNKTCVKKCPSHFPFDYNKTVATGCSMPGYCQRLKIEPTCLEECPSTTYIYNKTCYNNCPADLYTLDSECVAACPKYKPLTQLKVVSYTSYHQLSHWDWPKWKKVTTYKNIIECVTDCEQDNVIANFTCAKQCPEDMKYVTNNTCHALECETKYIKKKLFYFQCLDTCEDGNFLYNRTCLDNCPDNTFLINTTCVSECPVDRTFIINRTVGIKCDVRGNCEGIRQYSECESECPIGTYTLNNTCFDVCPSSTFTLGYICVLNCPASHQYHLESIVTSITWSHHKSWSKKNHGINTKLCVDTCSNPNFPLDRNSLSCVKTCPEAEKYILNNTCVSNCSAGSVLNPLKAGIECLRSCPPGKQIYNGTCHVICPFGTYSYNNIKCVHDCPAEKPRQFRDNETWMCMQCEDGEYLYKGECQYDCPDPSFTFGGKCIEKCPEGTVWWYYSCSKTIEAVIECLLLLGVDFLILCFGRRILKEYFTVISNIICFKEGPDQQPRSENYACDIQELKREDERNLNSPYDIEMDEITEENMPLLTLEQLDAEEFV